jgi:nucleotide-binding universal stress UspA family protein
MSQNPAILLVPVDGSEGSSKAVRYAGGLAQRLDLPLRLLFVFPEDPVDMFGIPTEDPRVEELEYFSPDAFNKLRNRTAEQNFAAAREALGALDVAVEEVTLSGVPAEAIVDHARETEDPMIVIGSRGMGGIKSLLIGSVSQRVLHHAPCPVTVV